MKPLPPAYVYRLWDATDRLLYVGMSAKGPVKRIGHHLLNKWWGETVARIEIEKYPSRAAALRAESAAIAAERPRWNIDGIWGTWTERNEWSLEQWRDYLTNLKRLRGSSYAVAVAEFEYRFKESFKLSCGRPRRFEPPKMILIKTDAITAEQLISEASEAS